MFWRFHQKWAKYTNYFANVVETNLNEPSYEMDDVICDPFFVSLIVQGVVFNN